MFTAAAAEGAQLFAAESMSCGFFVSSSISLSSLFGVIFAAEREQRGKRSPV